MYLIIPNLREKNRQMAFSTLDEPKMSVILLLNNNCPVSTPASIRSLGNQTVILTQGIDISN